MERIQGAEPDIYEAPRGYIPDIVETCRPRTRGLRFTKPVGGAAAAFAVDELGYIANPADAAFGLLADLVPEAVGRWVAAAEVVLYCHAHCEGGAVILEIGWAVLARRGCGLGLEVAGTRCGSTATCFPNLELCRRIMDAGRFVLVSAIEA